MPTPTYDLIQEQVLSSSAASVTFSNIPGTYKDLVLEIALVRTDRSNVDDWVMLRINGDTGTNYSKTYLYGDGSTAGSGRTSNQANIVFTENIPGANATSGVFGTASSSFMSYANTNVNKTVLTRSSTSSSVVAANVVLWRSTSAITTLLLYPQYGPNFVSGSTFRLWGVSG